MDHLAVVSSPIAASSSAVELGIRRVASNESDSSSSPRDGRLCSKSFRDMDAYGVDSLVNLQSADEERWINSQQETFTNWVNVRLKSGDKQVTNLAVDLRDGTVLVRLVENLTGKKIKGYHKSPKLPAHMLDNLDLVFKTVQSAGIKVIGMGSHSIYKGNIKLILGLIWTLIQKYQLRMGGTRVSTKAVMMDWLKAMLPLWNITNLSTDWTDGRALVALINEVKPGIAPDASKLHQDKQLANCKLAIDIAFNHLKIPKLISADSLSSSTIDELSMVTYLSYFRDLARAKLLKWIRRMLPQFDITNFLTDWMDGRAFAALTNKCFPGTLPDSASVEKENPLENVQMVLDTIDVQLGIPTNFTAKKLLMSGVEELQVMTLIMRIRNGKLQPVANKVIVSGPGINEAVVGKETQFTVNTAQAGPGKLSVKATYEDDQTVDCHVREKGKIATVTYRPKVPGKIAIDIRWFDVPVPQSPFIVTATDSLMIKFTGFDDHRRVVHVNEPIQISLNTEKAGQGMLTAHLKYNSDAPIPARVTKRSNSTTKMTYTPPKSGEAVLHVIWNGKEMTHLTVTYTVVDSASYQVSTRPEDREYMVNEKVRFIVTTKEAPLNILQMKAVMQGDDGGLNVPICFDTIEGNQGRATFRPTMHGTYRIEVTCIDKVVQGSPFHVNIVDPTQCKIVGDIPKYLQLNVPYTFDVEVKHAGKGMLKCEYEENQRSADAFETNISPPDKSGISKVRLTPQCNGDFLVTFKSQGTDIPGCPFRVLVCDPLSCHVTGVALEKRSAKLGKLIRLKVAFDPVEDLKPSIKVTGPSAKYTPEITETEEDTYTVQFTPWEVGTHEISITYGDFQVPKSPFRVAVISFDSSICSATGSGLQKAFTGIPAQFVVLAKEEGLLKDGTLQIAVKGVVNNTRCKVKARDSKNGKYNVAYVVHDPGSYLISILASGKPIAGSPFRLTALPGPMANKCLMYGPILQPNAVLTIGKPMDFAVDTSAAGVGNLSVKAIGPGDTQARVYLAKSSEKKGVHNVKLDPIRHGRYRVSVKWSDEHIPGSPFMLSIYPGADASKCKAYGPGLEDGLVGKPSSFTIETRDAGAGTLKVRLHGVKGAFKTDIKPIDQHNIRTLQANYNPKREGDYLVSIQWSDRHVPGSPFRVKIAGNGTTINDESLKAIAQDEVKDSIAEELDDANWGDEEEGTTVTQSEPVLQKRKKKLKKHRKTSDSNEGDIIPSNTTTTTPIPSDTKLPSFRSTSMNYREAFVRGGSGRQQVAKKMSKGTRGKRSKK